MTQGKRLKELREYLRLTQIKLAEKLKISKSAISKVESDLGNFSIEIYVKLVDFYDVNLNWLLAGKGEMFIKNSGTQEEKIETQVKRVLDKYGLTDVVKD